MAGRVLENERLCGGPRVSAERPSEAKRDFESSWRWFEHRRLSGEVVAASREQASKLARPASQRFVIGHSCQSIRLI